MVRTRVEDIEFDCGGGSAGGGEHVAADAISGQHSGNRASNAINGRGHA